MSPATGSVFSANPGLLSYVSGPVPASVNLSPGAGVNQVFNYVFAASLTGTTTISASVAGIDANSGVTVTALSSAANAVTVQLPPQLAAEIDGPANYAVGAGTNITFTVSVTNTGIGSATLNAVSVNPQVTGGVSLISVTPSTAVLAGGASKVFSFIYSAGVTLGTVVFTPAATGLDSNSGALFTALTSTVLPVSIAPTTPVLLVSSLLVSPSTVSVGELLTVVQVVKNIGVVDAPTVTVNAAQVGNALVILPGGNASIVGSVQPSAFVPDLAPGASASFTYVYTAGSPGSVLQFSATASSLAFTSASLTSNTITVQTVPVLMVASLSLAPSTMELGQAFTLLLAVSNSGSASAVQVAPLTPSKIGFAQPNLPLGGPFPLSATVAGGQTQVFTFTGINTSGPNSPPSPWNLGYQVQFSGKDLNTGIGVSSATSTTAQSNVVRPTSLQSAINVAPAALDSGQSTTVIMTVSNSGDEPASGVAPSTLSNIGSGGILVLTGPLSGSTSIAAGGSTSFTWTYTAVGTGTLVLSGNATGVDTLTLAALSSTPTASNLVSVQSPASLLISSFVASPSPIGTGSFGTVVLGVSNTGQTTAVSVSITGLAASVPAALSVTSGPLPASVASIPSGGVAFFTYTYSAVAASGSVAFTASARGFDAFDNSTKTSAVASSNSFAVNAQGSLAPQGLSILPAGPIDVNQSFTVLLTVSNTGLGNVLSVTASALTPSISGLAGLVAAPLPVSGVALIAPGSGQTFTYTYSATAAGSLSFTGRALGTDANSGAPISSPVQGSAVLQIQNPAQLSALVLPVSSTVTVGQSFAVLVLVTNTAAVPGSIAVSVSPGAALSLFGSGLAAYNSGPTPAAVNLSPGAGIFQAFTYSYLATLSGTVQASASVRGMDILSGLTQTVLAPAGAALTMQTAPQLLAQNNGPLSIAIAAGSNETFTVTVSNTGASAATANAISATTLLGGSGVNFVSASPASAQLAANSSAVFTFIYQSTGPIGTVIFTPAATGLDANSGIAYSALTSTVLTLNVAPNTPLLHGSLAASPATITLGQKVTVVEVITNAGVVDASPTTANALSFISGLASLTGSASQHHGQPGFRNQRLLHLCLPTQHPGSPAVHGHGLIPGRDLAGLQLQCGGRPVGLRHQRHGPGPWAGLGIGGPGHHPPGHLKQRRPSHGQWRGARQHHQGRHGRDGDLKCGPAELGHPGRGSLAAVHLHGPGCGQRRFRALDPLLQRVRHGH